MTTGQSAYLLERLERALTDQTLLVGVAFPFRVAVRRQEVDFCSTDSRLPDLANPLGQVQ